VYCGFFIFHYAASLVFAILSDSVLSRYKTLLLSTGLYCVGCAVLTASSSPSLLQRGWGIPGLSVAMAFVGLGAGGFRAVMFPFMVDQCEKRTPAVKGWKGGRFVVTDSRLTVQFVSSLHYWYVWDACIFSHA
jgi:POT family proton-dependent oligopeptide transporter